MISLSKNIRPAERKDISVLVDFNKAMAKETEGLDLDTEILKSGVSAVFDKPERGFYLVSEIEGVVRASLLVTFEWSDWRNGTFYWIQSVFVEKEFRKQGLYKGLYTYLQHLLSEKQNVAGIRLYVEKDNQRAKKTYEKLGMKKMDYLFYEKDMTN